ncbi:MAG TPA: DUF4097 family beta strand repeat-containing protein [Anditalea sp.]|nr:DUF4097 family beta strand repeat-containing protein [Anditalea sp.]
MYNKIIWVLSFMISLPLLASAQVETLVDMKKEYSGISQIEVESGMLTVTYEGKANATAIDMEAFLESNNDQGQDIVFVTIGNTLKIKYQSGSSNFNTSNNRTKGHIKMTGPEDMKVTLSSSSGTINISNLSSDQTTLKVSSGNINLSNIRGDLSLSGSSGRIIAQDIDGAVKCKISSGYVELTDVDGPVDFSSSSGRLNAKDIRGKVNVSLSSGSINMENIAELGELSLSSGSIKAENAGLSAGTKLNGSSGSIRIKTPTALNLYNFNLNAGSGSLRVGDVSKAKHLEINNYSQNTIKGSIGSGTIAIVN